MRESLRVSVRDEQYSELLSRYHFAPRDLEQLRQTGALVLQAAEPRLYWERSPGQEESGGEIAAIVTLGAGVDELQERYQRRERLTESYMTECVGMELLRAAYEQTAERIHERTGGWLTDFVFVGDRLPFARMEDIFRLLRPEGVSYNQAYMLTPKKTVVFVTSLCGERKDSYCHICAGCGNLSCGNREETGNGPGASEAGRRSARAEAVRGRGPAVGRVDLTYGYQRIFGERQR